jgi:large subunit ribosomal protein L17
MVTSLFKYDRIQTTDIKAKELRRWADKLVTLAKRGDLHARRIALSIIRERDVVQKLFDEAGQRFVTTSGGYTRIVKVGRRPGDAAPVSIIELVSKPVEKKKKEKKPRKTAAEKPVVTVEPKTAEKEKTSNEPIAKTAPAESATGTVSEPEEGAAESPVQAPETKED